MYDVSDLAKYPRNCKSVGITNHKSIAELQRVAHKCWLEPTIFKQPLSNEDKISSSYVYMKLQVSTSAMCWTYAKFNWLKMQLPPYVLISRSRFK